ncbi:MAG: acyl-CoA dehydrogenase family protein [Myxococcaceae bacterium]|nr:acyl-CoA dehydrogenase family protein [Myxococcaceae bacterium]MCA3016559.1 acyl-CoA dehydrogenase family protein [Myxococcaceae bacterium]
MDFLLSEHLARTRARVRAFVDEHVIPAEATVFAEDREGRRDALSRLQASARAEGLWVPHLPPALGGLGLGPMGMCALFREMGRSPIGAKVFNCDAPDQGNMDLLLMAASPALQERYLGPLVRAEVTSAFCMTEPAPGAGADPTNLRTVAKAVPGGWELTGRKWYSTGARNAAFCIVMARTSDDPKTGATLFLVDRKAPGVTHVRDVPTMGDQVLDHHEGELAFEGVTVGPEAVLGQVGEGFKLAQVRLVPARLTHCMRWLGLAERTLELCRAYVTQRVSFGKELARHQLIQDFIARNAMGIHAGNLMTLHAAWMLEQGQLREAKPYSSMAKTHVARLLCQVLDDAIQMHGGLGYSDDVPFSRWYRSARAARIADGPDEVHLITIARDWLLGRLEVLV